MKSEPAPIPGAHILVFDADQSARVRRRAALEGAGLCVLEAATYTEALRIAREANLGSALLSGRLADGSLALCRDLRDQQQTAEIPILILGDSANSYPEALEAGADAFLQEPAESTLLIKTLGVLMARSSNRTKPAPGDEAAGESDHYWRAIVESVPAILCRNRADGSCECWNHQAYEYTGMPPGSLEGLNWLELIHPEDRTAIRETWLAGVAAGVPFVAEYRLRRADGEYRWFHSRVIPAVMPRTAKVEWFGVSTEIHELRTLRENLENVVVERTELLLKANAYLLEEIRHREPTEQMLPESEESYRSLFENATVGLYRTTPGGRILMANPALIAMLRFDSFEELARRNLEDLGLGPEHSWDSFRRRLEAEGTIRGLETAWRRRDGTLVFVRESARVARDCNGKVRFYDGIVEEVTGRREAEGTLRDSEERFRAIFDQASVGIVEETLDGRFTAVNERYCELTGYSRAELLTMRYQEITHPDDLDASIECARKLLSGEISEFILEKRYLRKDGSPVWVRKFGTLAKQQGGLCKFVGIAEDISERKRIEEELQGQLEFDRVTADLLTRFASCSVTETDGAVAEALRVAAVHCGADHAILVLQNGEDGFAQCSGEWCSPDVRPSGWLRQSIPLNDSLWSVRKADAREEVVLHSLNDLPAEAVAERDWLTAEGARGVLHMPIEIANGKTGCMILHRHHDPHPWSNRDRTRLRIVANAIAALLEGRHAEQLLRQSEEMFSLVFHSNPEAIVITSVPHQIINDVNAGFTAISGYSREEAIGKTILDLGLFPDLKVRNDAWERLLKDHILLDFDLVLRSKSGSLRSGLLSSVLVVVQKRQYLISMFRDLTERRRVQDESRRQAAFDNLMAGVLSEFVRCQTAELSQTIDKALEAIAAFFFADHVVLLEAWPQTNRWGVTREWCAPHVSPIAETQQGFPGNERLCSDTDVLGGIEDLGATHYCDLEGYRDEGVTCLVNVPIKSPAGTVSSRMGLHRHGDPTPWAPADASRLRVAGTAIGGALQRTRAEESLRESECRFRDLTDSAPLMTWSSGPNKEGAFYNRQAAEFTGRTVEQLIGEGWVDLIHPADRDRYVATFFSAADARESFSAQVRFRRADGAYRWILITGVPRIVNGTYRGHMGTGIDITDLKNTFEQHLAAQKLESLGVLAAGVAHDFNNLLGAIVARAESAQTDLVEGSSAAEDVDQILAISHRAAGIVTQLMAFARKESLPSTMADLSQIVAETLDILRFSIAKTAILKTDLAAGLPPVHANSAEIRQVVMNLIVNASEALEGKPGAITISTACAPSGAPVVLKVEDSGSGMTDEVKQRIFDPFFTTRFEGRGLGLSAVQGIVRRHGGSIQVESSPGKGSRFTVLLPPAEDGPKLAGGAPDTGLIGVREGSLQ